MVSPRPLTMISPQRHQPAQPPRDRETILGGQAQVEQHDGRGVLGHQLQQLAPACHRRDPVPLAREIACQKGPDIDFIINDDQMAWLHEAEC